MLPGDRLAQANLELPHDPADRDTLPDAVH
jgi:hypothetical protein